MPRKFNIPNLYKSPIIRQIKKVRQVLDPRKKDMSPVILDLGSIRFLIPRHFGFCFGVQNAIEIAYKAVEENPYKNIYLLSEMIHNPTVNKDLEEKGVRFIYETDGSPRIALDTLSSDDIVIVPAFGTTLEIEAELKKRGISPYSYNTTCPFVEKVWKRGSQLSKQGHSLVIHGKYRHEETRATFSHAAENGPAVIVLNVKEARLLAEFMLDKRPQNEFLNHFRGKCTPGFNPLHDLEHLGVINQTTMLATETQEVMDVLRDAAKQKYGESAVDEHMAETKDTLCYATNENQSATYGLMQENIDLALVVGGYNSSNTMHIVELLEGVAPTYHIRDAAEFETQERISHFDQRKKTVVVTQDWLPIHKNPLSVAITSGASCPDALVDEVIFNISELFPESRSIESALNELLATED